MEERESIPAQKEDGIAYANEQGWRYQIYDADCDISGTADITDRPAMSQLMKDMAAGKIHTVICRALDRLFRNHYEQDKFEALVVRQGIAVKGLKEDIDFTTFEGRLVAGIKGRMAAQDVAKRGSESKKSKERKAKAGTLRIRPPLGYQIVEFDSIRSGKVKESEAVLVREIFSRYIAGEGINQISKSLVARGATGKKNGQLNTSRISGIIHNPLYKGELIYKGQSYGSPYPAIIDAETWAIANQRASRIGYKGGKVSTRNKSLLAGLIKCGHCHDNAKAAGKAGYDYYIMQRLKQASGKQYNLYRCYAYARLGKATCWESKSIMADVIEPFATDWLHHIVENNLNSKVDIKAAQGKLEFINGKLADFEAHKQTLAKLLGSKVMDAEQFSTANATLRHEITSLEADRAEISATVYREQNGAKKQLIRWASLTIEQKRDAIKTIIKVIYVYGDRVRLEHTNGGSVEYPIKRGAHGRHIIDTQDDSLLRPSAFHFSNVTLQEAMA